MMVFDFGEVEYLRDVISVSAYVLRGVSALRSDGDITYLAFGGFNPRRGYTTIEPNQVLNIFSCL